jgi:hypothetical protein
LKNIDQSRSKAGDMISKGRQTIAERARILPILKRFPDKRAALRCLFGESSSFQSLCDDYRDCLAALKYWEQSISEEAPALARVYAELLGELEQEVRQYLEQEQAPG